jgi:hypothetical protein
MNIKQKSEPEWGRVLWQTKNGNVDMQRVTVVSVTMKSTAANTAGMLRNQK